VYKDCEDCEGTGFVEPICSTCSGTGGAGDLACFVCHGAGEFKAICEACALRMRRFERRSRALREDLVWLEDSEAGEA